MENEYNKGPNSINHLIPITKESSTTVFREYYESIRQLGDAAWLSTGYEPISSHEISMEILMDLKIPNSMKLDRFRRIRNSANYRGYIVSEEEAKEIQEFWRLCGKQIIAEIGKNAKL